MFGFSNRNPAYPAEAVMLAKHEIGSNNKRVVFYIGDPAMPLAFPKKKKYSFNNHQRSTHRPYHGYPQGLIQN